MSNSCLAVVLAAGEGKRMCSTTAKVLHRIAGLEMVCHVLAALRQAGCDDIALVVGSQAETVKACALAFDPHLTLCRQDKPLGTAHAVLAAREALAAAETSDVLIVFGDTPLLETRTLTKMRTILAEGADLVIGGFYPENPTGYGRLVVLPDERRKGQSQRHLQAIIEEKDANPEQRQIRFCNGGVMALRGKHALMLLEQVDNKNAAGEFYLPDVVILANRHNLDVRAIEVTADQVLGVNTRAELAAAEALWQTRKRQAVMESGVTLLAPSTVHFAYDSEIATDVVIEPHVFFGPGVKVDHGARIRAFSHIEGAWIGEDAEIGPFARLRAGTRLARSVKVGNFCEIKQAQVAQRAKINHLSYIGDAEIGAGVNIGAGTITCNYDGVNKWQTRIGECAFIGSNSALIAPVTIGESAYIASGSVITQDVTAQAVAFGRARQINKPERARELRARIAALKQQKDNM